MVNVYLTQDNKPNEELNYVLDYLGVSIYDFLKMSDEKIVSIYKRFADSLNDGEMTKSPKSYKRKSNAIKDNLYQGNIGEQEGKNSINFGDSGSKSRFFDLDVWGEKHGLIQTPKASKKERNAGCERLEEKTGAEVTGRKEGSKGLVMEGRVNNPYAGASGTYAKTNHHPTCKPVHLMSWLVRLISKEGNTVLDPFMGSGTTGVACNQLDRNFIGIELNEEYIEIAEARIEAYKPKVIKHNFF